MMPTIALLAHYWNTAPVWYLHSVQNIAQLEAIQKLAAHWVCE